MVGDRFVMADGWRFLIRTRPRYLGDSMDVQDEIELLQIEITKANAVIAKALDDSLIELVRNRRGLIV